MEQNNNNSLAIASFVIGLLGLGGALFFGILGWFFSILWILAIVFGFYGRKQPSQRGLALWGILFGLGSFGIAIIWTFIFFVLVSTGY